MVTERGPHLEPQPEHDGHVERDASRGHPWLIAALLLAAGYLATRFKPRRATQAGGTPPPRPHQVPTRRRGYEHRDASAGWIFAVVAILAVGAVVMHAMLTGAMGLLKTKPVPGDPWQPLARPARAPLPAQAAYPKLQVSPPLDLERFRGVEEARLNSYGWVNHSSGIAHIPITIAIDLLLKRPLPVSPREQGQSTGGRSTYELQIQRVEQRPLPKEAGQ